MNADAKQVQRRPTSVLIPVDSDKGIYKNSTGPTALNNALVVTSDGPTQHLTLQVNYYL